MSYLYDRKKKKKQGGIIFFAIIALVFLFTPFLSFLYDLVESPIEQAYKNTHETKNQAAILIDALRFSKRNLAEYNRFLKNEVEKLLVENERIHFLELELAKKSIGDNVFAYITERPTQSSLIIDQGGDAGIVPGDSVFSGHILIGEVEMVFDTSSRVILYTDKNSVQPAILYPHDVSVNIRGYGNLGYYLEIDRDIKVEEGNVVYSQSYPGYIMGVVRRVDFDSRDPFKKVFLSPSLNIDMLTSVEILKKTTINS